MPPQDPGKSTEAAPLSAGPAKNAPAGAPEPRWLALVALTAVAGLYTSLPAFLAIGPRWLLLVVLVLLAISLVVSRRAGMHSLNQVLGIAMNFTITTVLVISLVLLVLALPSRKEPPLLLMRSGASLWISNVLVFALWYWRLDAGGPNRRDKRGRHLAGAFLFPQMTLQSRGEHPSWSPNFIDYLFLAFNTSTALSPADTQALSRWAKVLMMIQSLVSLTVIVLLLARAVNIL